jgi:dynein heavy chain 1
VQACGPLVAWAQAQTNFALVLDRIAPLRAELLHWEEATIALQQQMSGLTETIAGLETSIARYKDEYAALIAETTSLKKEMERVSAKVQRSTALLSSLGSEQGRWSAESERHVSAPLRLRSLVSLTRGLRAASSSG